MEAVRDISASSSLNVQHRDVIGRRRINHHERLLYSMERQYGQPSPREEEEIWTGSHRLLRSGLQSLRRTYSGVR